ncbi:MAG: hypothetical protein Q9169_003289 [Polycauliona sp. 2 TL-2023]
MASRAQNVDLYTKLDLLTRTGYSPDLLSQVRIHSISKPDVRMKKLFHRKNKSTPSSPDQTPPRSRSRPAGDVSGDPSLRTSRYESTASAGLPQTGQYPLKGNNSAVALHGRRSDTYSRGHTNGEVEPVPRPSSSNPYYGSLPAPRVTSASYNHQPSGNPLPNRQSEPDLAARSQRRQSARYSIPPTEDFSNLNLGSTQTQQDYNDCPLRQQQNEQSTFSPYAQGRGYPTTRHERPSHESTQGHLDYNGYPLRQEPYGQDAFSPHGQSRAYPTANNDRPPHEESNFSRFQHDDRTEPFQMRSEIDQQPRNNGPLEYGRQDHHEDLDGRHRGASSSKPSQDMPERASALTGNRSIRRKEVQPQHPSATDQAAFHPSPNTGPRLSPRDPHPVEYPRVRQEETAQTRTHAPKDLQSTAAVGHLSAREVVDRARENTYDTEVVETIAPAVVHETVHDNVHHVREEEITKEVHNHDVFHRILPVIDVEVLPPRHFLPVEGGGLVEISGKEVPGRGNNWVVAETASKIPSDQAAPRSLRPFSARRFVGTEGDAMRYQMPEGHEKTEQTWVHPPELETGGRDSGQTWPMEFGSEKPAKSSRPKSSKSKHSRKPVGPEPPTMQQQRPRERM